MIRPILAAAALATATPGPAYWGPAELGRTTCIAAADAVRVVMGPFTLMVPFSDLNRLKARRPPEGDQGCAAPLPVDDLLISTPDGFRGNLTYRAAQISAGDAERVRATLRQFAEKPTCDARGSVRVCRVRANPMAPITTFVFASEPRSILPSGTQAYQRCTDGPGGQICKIQDLDPSGYQYEAPVDYTEDADTIRARHALARAKWNRFLRAAATTHVISP